MTTLTDVITNFDFFKLTDLRLSGTFFCPDHFVKLVNFGLQNPAFSKIKKFYYRNVGYPL